MRRGTISCSHKRRVGSKLALVGRRIRQLPSKSVKLKLADENQSRKCKCEEKEEVVRRGLREEQVEKGGGGCVSFSEGHLHLLGGRPAIVSEKNALRLELDHAQTTNSNVRTRATTAQLTDQVKCVNEKTELRRCR
jgi:uncharacterized FAD-dependent dehydrogenase